MESMMERTTERVVESVMERTMESMREKRIRIQAIDRVAERSSVKNFPSTEPHTALQTERIPKQN